MTTYDNNQIACHAHSDLAPTRDDLNGITGT